MTLLTWAILLFWVVALGQTLLNLAFVRRLRPRLPGEFPRVSAIIPARDEERTIERTVRALLEQTYPQLEIIVVNDRSTDATEAILRSIGGIVVLHGEEPPPGWLGKPWALHQGSLRATGDLLLFLDADVLYEPDAVTSAVACMEERDVALLSLFPRLEMRGFWEHVIMPNLAVFAFAFLPLWAANRIRSPLFAVGGGPGNLIRREAYDAAGGHDALKDAVVDDVALARLIRRRGGRSEAVRAEGQVRVRMYHGLAEIVAGFTKNAFAVFGYSYLAGFCFLAMAVVFHLLPWALAPFGDWRILASLGLIVVTRVLLFASIGYRLDNAILGHPLMIAAWCWILVRSIWLTGIRRQLHWRGRMYDAADTQFGGEKRSRN